MKHVYFILLLAFLMVHVVSMVLWVAHDFGQADILAYISDDRLHLLDISNHFQMSLAAEFPVIGKPYWSPDGSQIAFISLVENEGEEIFVFNIDSGDLRRITINDDSEYNLTWTQDSKHIVFRLGGAGGRYIINLDGTGEYLYTNDTIPLFQYDRWSELRQRYLEDAKIDGDWEIYLFLNDGQRQQLTDNTTEDHSPVWSPDFEQIAFVSDRDGNYELYLMDANCPNPPEICNNPQWRLTMDTANDNWPAWKPR